jgi:hypothetical protein
MHHDADELVVDVRDVQVQWWGWVVASSNRQPLLKTITAHDAAHLSHLVVRESIDASCLDLPRVASMMGSGR